MSSGDIQTLGMHVFNHAEEGAHTIHYLHFITTVMLPREIRLHQIKAYFEIQPGYAW